MSLITPTLSYDDVAQADVAIEAVLEEMELKKRVFETLDATCKADTILATNTSTLDVNEIAAATSRPDKVIGTHFFSPANVMRLMENVRGQGTSAETIATVMALSKRLGKVGVLVGVCDGFVGNRMLYAYRRQADFLLEEGALPQQLDKVIFDFGMPMGPFQMSDLAGLDVGWRVRKSQAARRPAHLRYSPSPTVSARWVASGKRPVRDGIGTRTAVGRPFPTPSSSISSSPSRTSSGSHGEPSRTTRSSPGVSIHSSMKAPRSSRKAGPACERYRHHLDLRLRFPTVPRRTDVLGRPRRAQEDLRDDETAARRARRLV